MKAAINSVTHTTVFLPSSSRRAKNQKNYHQLLLMKVSDSDRDRNVNKNLELAVF